MENLEENFLLTGGYSENGGGISSYKWDKKTKSILLCSIDNDCENPSYLAMHPSGKFIYAVNEIDSAAKISAHYFNESTGDISKINECSAKGAGMCHLFVNSKGTVVYGGNYNSGSLVAFQINNNGSLGKLLSNIEHKGSSIHERQKGSHVHQVIFDKKENYLICVDFGTDIIYTYKVNDDGSILENTCIENPTPKGEGPRHLVFSPSGKEAYAISELGNKILRFAYNEKGGFKLLNEISIVSEDRIKDDVTGGEIMISPKTGIIYASVRGIDEIVAVEVSKVGTMNIVGRFSSFGKSPRMFSFSKNGEYLFVSNQLSNSVVAVKMNGIIGEKISKIIVPDVSFSVLV
ncbi:MAG: lactonase family protein [Lachnospirales bacterium]